MSDPSNETQAPKRPAPYWNPYLSGIGLGLVLLLSFKVLGAGLGASGAIARASAAVAEAVEPDRIRGNGYLGSWFDEGSPLAHYLVFMAAGTFLGGLFSAMAAGRTRGIRVERGPRVGRTARLALAVLGGLLVGFASRLAGGCTSGQALTGGALLLQGSWAFMFAVFAGGFGAAAWVRKEWE